MISKFNLDRIKNSQEKKDWVKVGLSTCGIAAGADEVFLFLSEELKKRGVNIEVLRCGCLGKCYAEPLVEVKIAGLPVVTYGTVDKTVALDIIEKHIISKKLVNGYIYGIKEC